VTEAYDINLIPASEQWEDHIRPDECPCGPTVDSKGTDNDGDAYIMYRHHALPAGA
jgi:hypothetical protein